MTAPHEFVYYENDILDDIFFCKTNECYLVLPRYADTAFLKILKFTTFGLSDFIAALYSKYGCQIKHNGIMSVFDPKIMQS